MTLPILIVDDEPDSCDTLSRSLRCRGYRVDVAYDGPTALRLAEQNDYGLAVIDYHMPGMNGVDLFRHLREKRPNMTGIFLTGYTTIDVVYPAIREGILRILPKPVDFAELDPIIDEFVGAPA
jgi:DNA-binding NtrC family response regulator